MNEVRASHPEPVARGWLGLAGRAGLASIIACIGCCMLPVIVAVLAGSGVGAGLARVIVPGSEAVVAVVVFVVALAGLVVRERLRVRRAQTSTPSRSPGDAALVDVSHE